MKDDRLDGTLRTWATRRARGEDAFVRVRSRAAERLREEKYLDLGAGAPASGGLARTAGWVLATAAFVVLALLWRTDPGVRETVEPANGGGRELARIAPRHALARARLFDETGAVFADRLRWLATIGGDVQVGLSPEHDGGPSDAPPLFVRLVVVLRLEGRDEWQSVWSADVLTRSREFVVVRAAGADGGEVTLWVDPRDDGRFLVESDLALRGPVRLATSAARLLVPGEPEQVLSLRSPDGEVRVYQTVEPLGDPPHRRG